MTIKAVIADDEKELRTYLKKLLADIWPELMICGEAANGEEAMEMVQSRAPEIVFLDIRMPGLSGLDVAKTIADQCHIVFVTAYDQYSVSAFEQEALDYLVKPVTTERLTKTVNRLKKQLRDSAAPSDNLSKTIAKVIGNIQDLAQPDYLSWIKVLQKGVVRLIGVDEIDYFQAADKYILVFTADSDYPIKKTIKELSGALDPGKFWQIHRGTIVNVSKIESVSRSITGRGVLKLKNRKDLLSVSRQYLYLFKQM